MTPSVGHLQNVSLSRSCPCTLESYLSKYYTDSNPQKIPVCEFYDSFLWPNEQSIRLCRLCFKFDGQLRPQYAFCHQKASQPQTLCMYTTKKVHINQQTKQHRLVPFSPFRIIQKYRYLQGFFSFGLLLFRPPLIPRHMSTLLGSCPAIRSAGVLYIPDFLIFFFLAFLAKLYPWQSASIQPLEILGPGNQSCSSLLVQNHFIGLLMGGPHVESFNRKNI